MKNRKMSVTIAISVVAVSTICIYLLYLIASMSMTKVMKQSTMDNLHAALNVQAGIIEEYIAHQEDLLISYSEEAEIRELLLDPENEKKRAAAQEYTEKYYQRLDNWEGIYVSELDTHVIAHSNLNTVGMFTRQGESREELRNRMLSGAFYNAGMIVSPASGRLIISLYCPVYAEDDKTVIGYVGGGINSEALKERLEAVEDETTRYYMLNVTNAMYIFAQEKDLMATDIGNEHLLAVLGSITEDAATWEGEVEHRHESEEESIAAYQYMPNYKWVLVSCNSEKNTYTDVRVNMHILAAICILSEILIGVLSGVVIHLNTRPLKHVEEAITQLKELKLEKNPKLDRYIDGKSEVGQIATAIDSLYDSIGEMLEAEKEKQIAIAENKSKERFIASMSHEIRTPINTVLGMNEMILRESKEDAVRGYAVHIENAGKMLLGIVNNVLEISKMREGKTQIVEENYQLLPMLEEVVLSVEGRVKEKGLKLKQEINMSLPSVLRGDEMRIKQVVMNLLSNAVKYTEEGSITFTVKGIRKEGGFFLIVSVTDTGIGIRREDMDKLFDRFYRLDLKRNQYIEGTGLGLSIAKQLVDNMGGRMEVSSEYGSGSCFTVIIPQMIVDETPLEQVAERETSKNAVARDEKEHFSMPEAKVLIVDDNKMNLSVLEMLLKRSQVQVECAGGGSECLQMTIGQKYDLILMDHMMPEPDGVQTLHLIREDKSNKNCQTPIVVVTANAQPEMEQFYMNEGFSAYITKPVMPEKLEEVLKAYLGKNS